MLSPGLALSEAKANASKYLQKKMAFRSAGLPIHQFGNLAEEDTASCPKIPVKVQRRVPLEPAEATHWQILDPIPVTDGTRGSEWPGLSHVLS